MEYKVITTSELYHHGVLGQKWGVRRYQNKDGSLTNAGKKRYSDSARKFVTWEYDTDKKINKLRDQQSKEIDAIPKLKDNEWYTKDRKLTDKAHKYYDKVRAIENKYSKKRDLLRKQKDEEIETTRKNVLFDDNIKQDTLKARSLNKQISSLRNDILGETSKNASIAYKQYVKENPGDSDPEYGFFHYEWRPGNKYYDKALKQYKEESGKLEKEYDSVLNDMGKKIITAASDTKISDLKDIDTDYVKFELNQIISFRDEYFNN